MTKTEETFIADFNFLADAVHENAVAHGFYVDPPRPLERIALMHEELGEASSAYRHQDPSSDHIPKFTGQEEELADTIIRIMDYSAYTKLRVAEAIIAKMAYNKTRPYLHGKIK